MSHSTSARPSADALPATVPPSSSPVGQDAAKLELAIRRLRAEAAATREGPRLARLLSELGELQERSGDDGAAARDYLAAYDADPSFREPLEGLVRLLERRPTLKTLARLFDALVSGATTPDERVRALVMRGAYQADVVGDNDAAVENARQATLVEGAHAAEQAGAWLFLEILAGRVGDVTLRQAALRERSRYAADATWRALLLVDRARTDAASGEIDAAISLLEQARQGESETQWMATWALEQVIRHSRAPGAGDAGGRAELHASVLEAIAALVDLAIVDRARGDARGVPYWAREAGRAVDAWLRAAEERRALGQLDAAGSALDKALAAAGPIAGPDASIAEAAIAQARIRLAEQTGDTALAARLARRQLSSETDGRRAAALSLRIAEHAAAEGDAKAAVEALGLAIRSDPGSLPARALQLDILADGEDPGAFAAQVESFAEYLATDAARAHAFLLAAYVWAVGAHDAGGAKAALSQAAAFGLAPEVTWRFARMLASLASDSNWYEEATRRLVACGGDDAETVSLFAELVRLRDSRGDTEGAARALRDFGERSHGAWMARVVEAFSPPQAGSPTIAPRARAAVEELASREPDPEWTASLTMVAAMRAYREGDLIAERAHVTRLADRNPGDAVVAAYAGDLARAAGDSMEAARIAAKAAEATEDPELGAAFLLEAAFETWRGGMPEVALSDLEGVAQRAPASAAVALRWAPWGLHPNSTGARRHALDSAAYDDESGKLFFLFALERFANELAAGDRAAAVQALSAADSAESPSVRLGASLARILAPDTPDAPDLVAVLPSAFEHVAQQGPRAAIFAAEHRLRRVLETDDADAHAQSARFWFEAGGGFAAALEWIAAATVLGDARQEMDARFAAGAWLDGEARDAMLATATLQHARIEVDRPAPLVAGESPAARLANLELSPPGCDPRRRAAALSEIGDVLGDEAELDAAALAGWSYLAADDFKNAEDCFRRVTEARPGELACWEGLRFCAQLAGNRALRADASAELGARCADGRRGAAFWEESALLRLEIGDGERADQALEASFERDPTRPVAFDKMFRRIRDRKDNAKLLAIIARRLDVSNEPEEIQKLFWEQARTLRESGDQDGALKALEHVAMLEPDHVGALALLGEINLRRGQFEEAAAALARLAMLDSAPAKNRVTAGVAAVDIYENKMTRFDKSLEVLLALHAAKLSTLPVRERLARTAARTGAWTHATAVLEQLMHERPTRAGRAEAARLAMAIRCERLGNPESAAACIVKLLEEIPGDGEALDLLAQTTHPHDVRERLLTAAATALTTLLTIKPTDEAALRRLAFVARDLRDDALAQAALGTLAAVGASDLQTEQGFAHLAARKQRTPQAALSDAMMYALRSPGDDGPVADLFVLLGPTLSDAFGPGLAACGVGRRDKVDPRTAIGLRNEIAAWAGAFGLGEFDLYVGGMDPLGVQGVSGDTPAIVVGTGINAPLGAVTRARVARELFALVRGTTVVRLRDDVTVAAIVTAACRLAGMGVTHSPFVVVPEIDRLLGKALPRRTRRLLPDVCKEIVSQGLDPREWSTRAIASHDRVSAVASGDPSAVLGDILGVPADQLGQIVPGNPRAEELLRFVLSKGYLYVRGALGLGSGA